MIELPGVDVPVAVSENIPEATDIDEFLTVRLWKLDERNEDLRVCCLIEIASFEATDQPADVDARLGSFLEASFDDILEVGISLEALLWAPCFSRSPSEYSSSSASISRSRARSSTMLAALETTLDFAFGVLDTTLDEFFLLLASGFEPIPKLSSLLGCANEQLPVFESFECDSGINAGEPDYV